MTQDPVLRSAEQFCEQNFPVIHKAKRCACFTRARHVMVVKEQRKAG